MVSRKNGQKAGDQGVEATVPADATAAMRDRIVDFRRVPASQLEGAPWNWRLHGAAQQDAFAGSLEELGFYSPLEVRELASERYQIIDGHLRQDWINSKIGPATLIPIIVTDFTEEEAKKANLTKDPLAAMAEANGEALSALMREVEIGSDAVNAMLTDLAQRSGLELGVPAEPLGDPDAVPEPPDQAFTQPGDLWILGNHRLLCGDSSKAEDVDRLLEGAPIHLVNTDPPYNVKVEPRSNNAIAAGLSSFVSYGNSDPGRDVVRHPEKSQPTTKKLRAKDRPLANDFVSDEEFDRLLHAWFGNLARVLLPGRAFYIWGGYSNIANYPGALEAAELYFSQTIIWDKQHPVLTRKDYMGAHEWAFYGWKEGAAHQYFGPNNATDLWAIKKVTPQSMEHLTQKPVELAARAIEYSSRPGENVLDLFAGSGSTLIAAEQTGRRCYTMELDPLYADLVVDRWQRFTGRVAVHAVTGQPFPKAPPSTQEALR